MPPNKPMDPTGAARPRLIGEALGRQAWWSEWTIDGCILEIADVLVAMREAPRCNQIRSMSELAMPLQDTSVAINIGHAQSAWRTGQLK